MTLRTPDLNVIQKIGKQVLQVKELLIILGFVNSIIHSLVNVLARNFAVEF